MRNDRSREARLRRLARDEGKSFHKARRPFEQWGVRAAYYVSDMTNTLVAVYASLDAAEEDFQGKRRSQPIQFDWRRHWKKRVEPLLGNPLVQGALNLGMSMLDPEWKAGDPPHLLGRLDPVGGRIVKGKLSWYRPHGRCHWIVFFSYTIGLLTYPHLRWEIVSGDLHTIAVGYDADGDPEMIMDILLFDHMTGEESIRHAEKKVEGFPETNMAEGYEAFVNGLRRLCSEPSVQPGRSHSH